MDKIDTATVFIKGEARLDILMDIKASAEIEDPNNQALGDNADFNVDLFGRVVLVRVLNGVRHGLGQHQVEVEGQFFTISALITQGPRTILADMSDQAKITSLIRNFYVDSNPVSHHGFGPG